MTPEEQAARAIIEARCDHDGSWYNCDYCLGTERLIVAALRQARREERERRDRLCKGSGYAGALMLRVFEQDDALSRGSSRDNDLRKGADNGKGLGKAAD